MRQTSQSRRTEAGSVSRSWTSGIAESALSAISVVGIAGARQPFVRPVWRSSCRSAGRRCRNPAVRCASEACGRARSGGSRIASTSSSSNGRASPVTRTCRCRCAARRARRSGRSPADRARASAAHRNIAVAEKARAGCRGSGHPDGIGRNQVVDIAILVERHLRVARARAERTPSQPRNRPSGVGSLGDRIERYQPRSRRSRSGGHPAYLFRTAVGQGREPVAFSSQPSPARAPRSPRASSRRPGTSSRAAPRARSSRSVNTCPRSGSAQSWISSTATKSAPISSGMALDRADPVLRPIRHDPLYPGDQRHDRGSAPAPRLRS